MPLPAICKFTRFCIYAIAVLLIAGAMPLQAKTLQFAGFTWTTRGNGTGSPGDNSWRNENAWVDATGKLHLRTSYSGGRWHSAEVFSTVRLGYGTYEFSIDTPLDQLDKNVVLGLFSYPTQDVGPDRTHEIDIEIARWGETSNKPLNYSVWPTLETLKPSGAKFELSLNGPTLHRWVWTPTRIDFASAYRRGDGLETFATYAFKPSHPQTTISRNAMPVHINLWLKAPPSNGRPVEIVISDFRFKPSR